jgi:hypothetical protein
MLLMILHPARLYRLCHHRLRSAFHHTLALSDDHGGVPLSVDTLIGPILPPACPLADRLRACAGLADLLERRAPSGACLGLFALPSPGAAEVSGVRAGPQGRRVSDAQQPYLYRSEPQVVRCGANDPMIAGSWGCLSLLPIP